MAPDLIDEPKEPASPACLAHEADDAYMGFATKAEVAAFLEELMEQDAAAAGASPKDLARTPNRRTYAGLVALQVHLRARRRALFEDFLELWRDYERKGFAARLAFALSERSQSPE